MILSVVPFAARGAIWYQGESNAGRGTHYRVQLERLIASWRKLWGQDLAFYFVQLPNFMAPWTNPIEEGGWPDVREAFMNTAKEVPNTGMAVTVDIGHTYSGDVRVVLRRGSQSVVLQDQTGGSTDDIKTTFAVTDFDGADMSGEWALTVTDHAAYDTGTLNGWSMEIHAQP